MRGDWGGLLSGFRWEDGFTLMSWGGGAGWGFEARPGREPAAGEAGVPLGRLQRTPERRGEEPGVAVWGPACTRGSLGPRAVQAPPQGGVSGPLLVLPTASVSGRGAASELEFWGDEGQRGRQAPPNFGGTGRQQSFLQGQGPSGQLLLRCPLSGWWVGSGSPLQGWHLCCWSEDRPLGTFPWYFGSLPGALLGLSGPETGCCPTHPPSSVTPHAVTHTAVSLPHPALCSLG